MKLGEVTAMIGMITAGHRNRVPTMQQRMSRLLGLLWNWQLGLDRVSRPTELRKIPKWNLHHGNTGPFERIRMVNQFGEAAERIVIHEWTPETHDLATLPAHVERLTGA